MGCDIHHVVEKRNAETGKWEAVWPTGPHKNGGYYFPEAEAGGHRIWRNYDIFAVLADVRNRGGIVPISEPRGVPHDASDVARDMIDYQGLDAHSHSFVTLGELLRYDWQPAPLDRFGPSWFGFLRLIAGYGGPDDVRLVFCFDS